MLFDRGAIEKNCEEFFELYMDTAGSVHSMCERKILHTQEVAKNSLYLAKHLNFNEYDTDIAWSIGYLHDFARFGQAVVTESFKDSEKYNHAHVAAELLFHKNMIRDIIENYDEIEQEDKVVMEKAIYHHGDLALPLDLSPREKIFCELIREADKIDIFRNVVAVGYEVMYGAGKDEIAKSDISPEIEEAFYSKTTAKYDKRKTPADFLLAHIALFFGLNMEVSRQKVISDGYLKKMCDIKFENDKTEEKYLRMKKCLEENF